LARGVAGALDRLGGQKKAPGKSGEGGKSPPAALAPPPPRGGVPDTSPPEERSSIHPPVAAAEAQAPRYTVHRVLGVGALGIVSLAHDRFTNRMVALKELRPEHADSPEVRARFKREIEITAQLEHPVI